MLSLFTGSIPELLPKFFYPFAFVLAAVLYFYLQQKHEGDNAEKETKKAVLRLHALGWGIIAFRIAYACFLTIGQYLVWSSHEFTRLFLPPHRSLSYFFTYASVHFWLNTLIAIACGVVFGMFLRALRRHKARFFDMGEVELGSVVVLIIGWPNFISFLIILFFSIIFVSIFRRIFMGESYTTLGTPFLVTGLILLIWGDMIAELFNLSLLGFPRM